MNLLDGITPANLAARGLTWNPAPTAWEPLPGGGIRVGVPPAVDYFQDPAGKHVKDDAPYLSLAVTGDFVAQVHVRPRFASTWDAGAVMVRHDSRHWAKLCFESTDLGTTAAVSVVTNGLSDDANGVDLTVPDLWLQLYRAGAVLGMHYALDGRAWRMVRLFNVPMPAAVRVGLVAQCPAGPGTTIDFLAFHVETRTVAQLRAGV